MCIQQKVDRLRQVVVQRHDVARVNDSPRHRGAGHFGGRQVAVLKVIWRNEDASSTTFRRALVCEERLIALLIQCDAYAQVPLAPAAAGFGAGGRGLLPGKTALHRHQRVRQHQRHALVRLDAVLLHAVALAVVEALLTSLLKGKLLHCGDERVVCIRLLSSSAENELAWKLHLHPLHYNAVAVGSSRHQEAARGLPVPTVHSLPPLSLQRHPLSHAAPPENGLSNALRFLALAGADSEAVRGGGSPT
ncbi:hypothetical protein ABL78_4523 [Leptomonas seymouri]|uniref:Uncharacterized protein n=1 Tax=Leptomonas seymouri TaxID=5684 RepID=A0A0N0P5U8_LEPSE|nr:hypothetical protein ABL78_4523 [Leptomonas seymouri]|eukprot:KPI86407.1 hypothetical protein ABL78_4523 [Leptomonas seymouri]